MNLEFELELTGLAYGGQAVGRYEGRAVFVPFGLPDELVRVRQVVDKNRYWVAEIIEILRPSPHRINPRCAHFGVCGGCHWQHLPYESQLHYKQQVVQEQFQRIGGLGEILVLPTIPSPDPWFYRTHVTLHAGGEGVGFVSTDDDSVTAITECHLIRPELLALFPQIPLASGRVRLQVGSDPREFFISPEAKPLAQQVHYTVKGKSFQVSAGSFFQVNLAQVETLVELVLNALRLTGQETVMDLYAGVGLFTAFLAEQAKKVLAIELFPLAVADARINLAAYPQVEMIQGAIEAVLPRFKGKIQAVVLDPPRAGLKPAALQALIRLKPAQIVYVSCDPATLARDTKGLVAAGYQIEMIQPVDMFPQTYHIETVVHFTR